MIVNRQLWDSLKLKLDESIDPDIQQEGLVNNYYLPLYFYLYGQASRTRTPLFIGINAPQGAGKTTLTDYLVKLFSWCGLNAVTLSIDDFYLTHSQQLSLARENPENVYLQQRGYPGTHDVSLGCEILRELQTSEPQCPTLTIPRYDKSLHNGNGDRMTRALWPVVQLPVDVVLLEGWMLGFRTLPPVQVQDKQLLKVNTLLADYESWHAFLHCFVYLCPHDSDFVLDWRCEAEERMKVRGAVGMSTSKVRGYVERFLPAYELYGPRLELNPPTPESFLKIVIGRNRLPV